MIIQKLKADSRSRPESDQLLQRPRKTFSKNCTKICSQLFELSSRKTDRQTNIKRDGQQTDRERDEQTTELLILHYCKKHCKTFYAWKQLLLSARPSHRNSVCLSVRPSVCHTGGSVKNGAS